MGKKGRKAGSLLRLVLVDRKESHYRITIALEDAKNIKAD